MQCLITGSPKYPRMSGTDGVDPVAFIGQELLKRMWIHDRTYRKCDGGGRFFDRLGWGLVAQT